MIYFDNAATTLHKPHEVIEAVVHAMTTSGNASRGTHTGSLAASRTVYETRKKIADFFHCSRADHVIFTSNSTEALNIAICGTLGKGDHIISTDSFALQICMLVKLPVMLRKRLTKFLEKMFQCISWMSLR